MATPLALVFDLIATDKASEVFKKVGTEASATAKETETLGSRFSKFGGVLALAGAAMTVVAVKMAVDMQESTAKIAGNAQITQKAAVGIGDAFLATAGRSTFSGKAMSDAFGPIAGVIQSLAGHTLTAADATTVMASATMLAEASGKPLAETTADLAAVMQNYGLKVKDAAEVSNTLFNASRLTNIDLDTLTSTVDKLHGKLGIASPSLADTSSLLVDLANHGISGSKGVLVVNSALTSLLSGSKGSTAELKTLGVHVFDVHGKFVGMKGVLEQLTPKLKDMSDKQRLAAESALFGSGAAKAMNSTIMAGVDGLGKATAAVTKHGAAEYAAKTASETLGGQLKTLRSAFADVMTIIGEKVIPVITSVIGWMSKHKVVVEILAGVVGGLMVAAMGAFAVSLFTAGGALAFLTWPIVAVIAGVAALVAGVIYAYNHFKVFHDVVNAVWEWLKGAVVATVGFVKDHWQLLVGFILGPVAFIAVMVASHWNEVKTATVGIWNAIVGFFQGIPGKVSAAIQDVIAFVKTVFSYTPLGIIVNNFGAIVSFIGGIPGKILGALGNLGGLLVSAGGDLLRGLANGISGAIGGVIDAAKNAASAAVNAVKGALGIHSPSTVFAELGAHTAQGFINGITGGTSGVGSAMRSMVALPTIGSLDFASSAVRSNAVKGVGAAGGGGGDIHLNATFTVDNQVLGHSLVKFSIAEARRNGTSGLKL